MKTLVSIKKDMEVNNGLALLIETLKTIAISQYYAAQKKLGTFEKFYNSLRFLVEDINIEEVNHHFIKPRVQAQAIIVITSDAGFLGGLNMRVVNTALHEVKEMPTTIITVGSRGVMYIQGTGLPAVSFPGIKDDEKYSQAAQLRDYIYQKVSAGEFGTVKVVYPRSMSLGVQSIAMETFLPFKLANLKQEEPREYVDSILESSLSDIIEYLVYLWMGMKFYDIFGLSRLAEFSARYFHLEESGEKLKEEDKKVKLQYFRIRHELADRSIRELVAGRFARG